MYSVKHVPPCECFRQETILILITGGGGGVGACWRPGRLRKLAQLGKAHPLPCTGDVSRVLEAMFSTP